MNETMFEVFRNLTEDVDKIPSVVILGSAVVRSLKSFTTIRISLCTDILLFCFCKNKFNG